MKRQLCLTIAVAALILASGCGSTKKKVDECSIDKPCPSGFQCVNGGCVSLTTNDTLGGTDLGGAEDAQTGDALADTATDTTAADTTSDVPKTCGQTFTLTLRREDQSVLPGARIGSTTDAAFRAITSLTGEVTLPVDKGPYLAYIFGVQVSDPLPAGTDCELTNGTAKQSALASIKVAVIKGQFDSVQETLSQMGYSTQNGNLDLFEDLYDTVTPKSYRELFYTNSTDTTPVGTIIAKYNAVFINCGNTHEEVFGDSVKGDAAAKAVLKAYVENGGILYVSDFAHWYFVEQIWPNVVTWYGGEGDRSAAKVGKKALLDSVKIADQALAAAMGTDTISVNFNGDDWVIIDALDQESRVLVEAAVTTKTGQDLGTKPLLFYRRLGTGVLMFTSFHEELGATPTAGTIQLFRLSLTSL